MSKPIITDIKNMNNLNQYIARNMQSSPESLSYRFIHDENETELTYAQLAIEVNKLSMIIRDEAKIGDRVFIAARPGIEFVIAFYGCLQSGCIAVPVFPPVNSQMANRFITVMKSANPSLILSDKQTVSQIKKGLFATKFLPNKIKKAFGLEDEQVNLFKLINQSKVKLLATESRQSAPESEFKPFEAKKEDIAFLQYTSGSTGHPKGVILTHGNLIANLSIITRHFDYRTDSQTFSWLPPYHDMGLIAGIIEPLYSQTPTTLMSPIDFIYHPDSWMKNVSKYRCTITGGPNFAFELCARRTTDQTLSQLDLSCLCVLANGSEPINKDSMATFYDRFCQAGLRKGTVTPCYGLAESSLLVASKRPFDEEKILYLDPQHLAQNKVVLLNEENGIPIVSTGVLYLDTKIVNSDTKRECDDNEVGEIWIKGGSVAKGYYNLPKETAISFNNQLKSDPKKERYLDTGDLGFIYHGELYICGRKKDLIIINGENFYPQDIEYEVMASSPNIRKGNVIAFSKVVDGRETLIIVAELRSVNKDEMEALAEKIQQNLSLSLHLSANHIYFIPPKSIPKTSTGKLQRRKCAQLISDEKLNIIHHYQPHLNRQSSSADISITSDHWLAKLEASPDAMRIHVLTELITNEIKYILSLAEKDTIDNQQGFFDMGFDSIKAIQLKSKLEEELGQKMTFNNDFIFNFPTIDKAAAYIVETLFIDDRTRPDTNQDTAVDERVAIIGMSGVFPQSDNIDGLWANLLAGKDCITDIPASRFDVEPYFGKDGINRDMITRRAGTISGIKQFDSRFFGISPKEATFLDPQQRLLMKHTWLAFEDSNINVTRLKDSDTGVFIGISTQDYQNLISRQYGMHELNAYMSTGNALSTASGRLSYYFGFQGPCLSIDTACSSSLVAVNEACRRLENKECSVAVAAGVNCLLIPDLFISFSAAGMLSEDGKCKTFDSKANGYVRGEGCGVVILKKLRDAIKDNNTIHAVIKGSGVSQDGRASGLTVPNGNSQQQLIKQTLKRSGVHATEVDYVECHGTGTSLGDPIEVNALNAVYGQNRDKPVYIGSVKANVGHLEAAAGITGLIKTVMCLKHRTIPKQIHFNELNPGIRMSERSFVADKQIEMNHASPMLAAISSFGFSGTNVHLILQQSTQLNTLPEKGGQSEKHLFVLSAKSTAAMEKLRENYQDYLSNTDDLIGDICYTAAIGRSHNQIRLAFIVKSKPDLIKKLKDLSHEPAHVNVRDEQRPFHSLEQCRLDYQDGFDPDFDAYYQQLKTNYRYVSLPLYPFSEQTYWLKASKSNNDRNVNERSQDDAHPDAQPQPELDQYIETLEKCTLPGLDKTTIQGEWVVFAEQSAFHALVDQLHLLSASSGTQSSELDNKHVLLIYQDNFADMVAISQRVLDSRAISYTLITDRAFPLNETDVTNPHHRKAVGFWQSFAHESVHVPCFLVDSHSIASTKHVLLLISHAAMTEHVVIIRDNSYVPRLCPFSRYRQQQGIIPPSVTAPSDNYQYKSQATYLITGGTGGLGLTLAKYLIEQGVKYLILISRHKPSQSIARWIKQQDKQGVSIHHYPLDIADTKALSGLIKQYTQSHPSIKGIFHAAGIHKDGSLPKLTQQDFDDVFDAKIKGSNALVKVFKNQKLDFIIFFSSIVSILGNPGQTNYAAANAYEDGLAYRLRQQGVNALSVNWGPFEGMGMAKELSQRHRHYGVYPVKTAEALPRLAELIARDIAQVMIATVDWSKLMHHNTPYLAHIVPSTKPQKSQWDEVLETTPPDELKAKVNKLVSQMVAEVLDLSDNHDLAMEQSLFDLGMDSILILELMDKLQTFFAIPASITNLVTIEDFTVNALSDYLFKTLKPGESAPDEKHNSHTSQITSDSYAQKLSSFRQTYQIDVDNIISVNDNLVCLITDYAQSQALVEQAIEQRVKAFEKIGVYSGAEIDQFDDNYHHIFIVDIEKNALVSGCRLALLDHYINRNRLFYSALEYEFEPQSYAFLQKSAELSRLFCTDVSINPVSDILHLLKGVSHYLSKYPGITNLMGSASLSHETPDAVIEALVIYFTQHKKNSALAGYVHAKEPFINKDHQNLQEIIADAHPNNLDELELILSRKLDIKFNMPFLFKLYDELNCQVICFAIDKDFGNVVDALLSFELIS